MGVTRTTLDEIMSRCVDVDQTKIDATTEADLRRQMIEDGQDPEVALDTLRLYRALPAARYVRRRPV